MNFNRLKRDLILAASAGGTLATLTLATACSAPGVEGSPTPNQGNPGAGGSSSTTGGQSPSSDGGIRWDGRGGSSSGGDPFGGAMSSSGGTTRGGAKSSSGGDAPGGGGASGGEPPGCGAPGFGGADARGGGSVGGSDGGVSGEGGGEPPGCGAPGFGGGGSDGGMTGGGGPATLPPFDPSRLVCFGEDYGQDASGYLGQCCYKALCYEPAHGAACVPANDTGVLGLLAYPLGSGECGCSDQTHAGVVGPFAPNPASPSEGTGGCCYLVGVIQCEGRPLRVDGAAVVAGVVRRQDWGF
jgi:hypothetical protein